MSNIPVMKNAKVHLLPGMTHIFTVSGRTMMDLVHLATRGNRRFLMFAGEPETDMRGFILQIRRVTPTMVRGQTLLEVIGLDRFIADRVYIPEDRAGLYP